MCNVDDESDYVLREEGSKVEERIWVSETLLNFLHPIDAPLPPSRRPSIFSHMLTMIIAVLLSFEDFISSRNTLLSSPFLL